VSVRRKGPKATAIRVATYVLLVSVAVVVIFPFLVAVTTSFKRNTDIFTYPPSLVPRADVTVPAERVGVEGDPVAVFTFPGRDDRAGQWALVDNDASLAEFRPLDDLERVIVLGVTDGENTGRTTTIDGEEEDVFLIDDGGEQIEAYRSRLTSGGLFVSVDDPNDTVLDLVNFATPVKEFGPRFANFTEVLAERDPETNGKGVGRSLTNTVLVTILVVLGQIITSILGGYAFARVQFKGRSTLFMMYLGSVMIPFVVLIIPLFQLMLQVNWRDNLVALIIPFAFSAYGTFLMRQFFLGIPAEIEEAALLDGASRSTILWKVMVPLARPAIATLATFGFLYAWNSFFWPLVIINSGNPDNAVLSLTLSTLGGRSSTDTNLVFAGAILAMTPPILVFLFAQRYFVENSASSGLK
jgi:ABC-type glycerol-3-phosphate transport system permease component